MRQNILDTIHDLVMDFVYYDRKEDETLSMNELDNAVKNGTITIEEMVSEFKKLLEESFKEEAQ
jgi:coenzyme F420-reducing hydrogenase gamma subunit